MEDTSEKSIEKILDGQKKFFSANLTKNLKFRIESLKKLKAAIKKFEKKITDALWTDLHKSYQEAYLTEISFVIHEIDIHLKHIRRWAKPKRAATPVYLLPSRSRILYEPLGVALIVAPWNYPFMLLMTPVVGAISSGCCGIIKPSPYTPNVAGVIEEMIHEIYPSEYFNVAQGGRKVNEFLFAQRFDMIFFTGSPSVGKVVMKAAAENLTPVVLELGGKSPCIVDENANIEIAAKRIAWGKTINAGQTCIAPDYLFVHEAVKDELLQKIGRHIEKMYGNEIQQSEYFPRIVNNQAFDRLEKLLQHGNIKFGGKTDRNDKYISPTIVDEVKPDFPVMQEEIFGPILPVLTYSKVDEALYYINSNEKPLAFYYFGKNKKAKDVLAHSTSGGACINDTILHIANQNMPFGGVGNSGVGKYHGYDSFLAFSNRRSVVFTPTWIDLAFRYVPFRNFKWVKKIM